MKLKGKALEMMRITEDQLFLSDIAMDLLEDRLTREEVAAKLLARVCTMGDKIGGFIL